MKEHYLVGSSLHNLIRILIKNKFDISFRYIPRLIIVLLISLVLYPFCIFDLLIYHRRINKTQLSKDPVFIIGHWRSGTTYMHNLISLDKQFIYPTTYQCFLPGMFLSGGKFLKSIFIRIAPEKRPMDNVTVRADDPQEEEFAINGLCPYSYYQILFFPNRSIDYYDDYALLKSSKSRIWKNNLIYFFKKIALKDPKKQILSKNPTNTVRIAPLLKIFPDAKFIYLKRNNEEVILSSRNLYQKMFPINTFQKINFIDGEYNLHYIYKKTLEEYEKQKSLLNNKNLIEIEYADFVSEPLKTLQEIYKKLELNNFDNTKADFISYIEEQKNYIPNTF